MRTVFRVRRESGTCSCNLCWSANHPVTSRASARTVSRRTIGTGTRPASRPRRFTKPTTASESGRMASSLPSQTRVAIVGGGIAGASVAYHLTKLGWKDVVLLEQNQLAGGTTWHAAGLVGRLRSSNSMTRINKYSAELYAGLEKETGQVTGWKQVGRLTAGKSKERMAQRYRTAAMSELLGVEVQIVAPAVVKEKWPLLRTDDILGGAWLPHDGKVLPREIALALATGARRGGAT